jgi:hypothetical protein
MISTIEEINEIGVNAEKATSMTGDKITTYLFGLNALINVILITISERRNKSDRVYVAYGRNLWQASRICYSEQLMNFITLKRICLEMPKVTYSQRLGVIPKTTSILPII